MEWFPLPTNPPDSDALRHPRTFLSARTSEADRILGLELGGETTSPSPSAPANWSHAFEPCSAPYLNRRNKPRFFGLDTRNRYLVHDHTRAEPYVLTTVREFRLLEYMANHRGRVLTRNNRLDAVWKETPFVTPRSIDVYIRRLREKIEPDPRYPQYLKRSAVSATDSKSQNSVHLHPTINRRPCCQKRANLVAARPCRIGAGT